MEKQTVTMKKESLLGDDYQIILDTTIPNKNSQSVERETKQKSYTDAIQLYKVKNIVVDGKSPIAYIKIGNCVTAIDKESVEELIEALKTILK